MLALPLALLGIFDVWITSPLADAVKFQVFDFYCQGATERFVRSAKADVVELDYWPYSGVIEDRYYATNLARDLLSGSPRIQSVHLVFELPRDKVVESSCAGKYVHVASVPGDVNQAVSGCGRMMRYDAAKAPRYAVRYSYAKPNIFAVREFTISVTDTVTKEVLATQRSYQLLLGGMNSRENRVWYGWGSAQGAKVCSLTPPKDFIMKAIGGDADG